MSRRGPAYPCYRMPNVEGFSALPRRRLALFALLSAILISNIGNTVARLAVPWYVLATTESPSRTGLAAFFGTAPFVFGAFFGGSVADRLGFKRTSVLADVLSGLAVAAIPLLASTVGLPFPVLLVLIAFGALFDSSGDTARSALILGLADEAQMSLERVNSLEEVALRLPLLIGPPIAGALIAVLDASRVLWLDAASFGLSALAVSLFVTVSGRTPRGEFAVGYGDDLLQGIRVVSKNQALLTVVGLNALTGAMLAPLASVLMPVYMRGIGRTALDLGLLIAVVGVGGLIGVGTFYVAGHRIPRRLLMSVGPLGLGGVAVVLATVPPYGVMVVAGFLGGMAYGPFGPLLTTIAAEQTPEPVRGRVFGTLIALATVASPVGVLLAGLALRVVGVQPTIALIGACLLLLAGWTALTPKLRQLQPGYEPVHGRQGLSESA